MRTFLALLFAASICSAINADDRISTTSLATIPDDPAAEIVAGVDRFLLRKLDEAAAKRPGFWTKEKFGENRLLLPKQLGIVTDEFPYHEGILRESPPIAEYDKLTIDRIRWPVNHHPAPQTTNAVGLWGEGIHFRPKKPNGTLLVIVPDADDRPNLWLPKPLVGDVGRDQPTWHQLMPTALAMGGVNVVVMQTTSRQIHQHRNAKMSRREYLHRSAFELGRTLTGYEVEMLTALLARIHAQKNILCGIGEGGLPVLITSAINPKIDQIALGSFLKTRDNVWSEPISRQIFGFHNRFDTAHLLALSMPKSVVVFQDKEITVDLPSGGGAPAKWQSPTIAESKEQTAIAKKLSEELSIDHEFTVVDDRNVKLFGPVMHLADFKDLELGDLSEPISKQIPRAILEGEVRSTERQFDSVDAYNQAILAESEYERRQYLNIGHANGDRRDGANRVDTSSPEKYVKSIERFRTDFRENVIGWFDDPLLSPNARSKQTMRGKNWVGHDVFLDVFSDVDAYGVLLVPNDLKPDDNRPVIVCQHGLEGRPQDTITGDHRAYHDFAAKLAEQGYVVFAPQNIYIGHDDFRTLQRKSYPMGKTLFSVIGAQHKQIIRWLKTIPGVDPDRIAFYGLSYGGKSAMRLPALLPEYCLSICSADFNDWVWKNASSRARYSYVGTGEYEIFEWDLGKKFNYAEMAALIAPRPFMVERGHYDGVAPDDRVAKEFAKVRFLYQARLKLKDQCEIEFFDGPHTINGQGTFRFLNRQLDWDGDK